MAATWLRYLTKWSWPRFAVGLAVAQGILLVRDNGMRWFMTPFVQLKPDITSEKTPMFEDEPLPFPETKEAVVKYITERRVYDPLAHDRFKPKEAELKRKANQRIEALATRLRDEVAHELMASGDFATEEALRTCTHVLSPPLE